LRIIKKLFLKVKEYTTYKEHEKKKSKNKTMSFPKSQPSQISTTTKNDTISTSSQHQQQFPIEYDDISCIIVPRKSLPSFSLQNPYHQQFLSAIAGRSVSIQCKLKGASVCPGKDWDYKEEYYSFQSKDDDEDDGSKKLSKSTSSSSDDNEDDKNRKTQQQNNHDDDEDNSKQRQTLRVGILLGICEGDVAWVRWRHKTKHHARVEKYRAGAEGKFDLQYCPC
jgi:hypothetical protein